jgi:hypothetical protein
VRVLATVTECVGDSIGLGEFVPRFIDFGVLSLQDILDSSLVSDKVLEEELGMTLEQAKQFRGAVAMRGQAAAEPRAQADDTVLLESNSRLTISQFDSVRNDVIETAYVRLGVPCTCVPFC